MNTLNICLGHLSFPKEYLRHVDLFVSPKVIAGPDRNAVVPDDTYGPNGHALSEYAQLLWIYKNIDALAPNHSYIRILQYRRFVSPVPIEGVKSTNGPWMTTIQEPGLADCEFCFDRNVSEEIYNTPVHFDQGVLMQYAANHVLQDLLNFTSYLVDTGVFSVLDACAFLRMEQFVPACNVGVFRKDNFKMMYHYIDKAASFMLSPAFVMRDGYQRRSMGFLIERFHSFLIFQFIGQKLSAESFGFNMVLSDTAGVTSTIERVAQ
jgi:hypothetical protein